MIVISRSSSFIFVSGGLLLLLSGLWELLGAPNFVTKGIFFLILLGIALISITQQKLRMPASHISILSAIFVLYAFSSILYSAPIVAVSYFQLFAPIIIFFISLSLLKTLNVARIEEFFLVFVFLQMGAALLKFILIGQSEGAGVGTISIQAGSASTFIGFFMCLVALRLSALGNRGLAYLVLFSAFLFVAINEKRLGILVVSLMSLFLLMWRGNQPSGSLALSFFSLRTLSHFIVGCIFALFLLIVGQQLIPTLTEGFNLLSLPQRIVSYIMAEASDGTPLGRVSGLFHIFGQLSEENKWMIGFGPMEFFSSNVFNVTAEEPSFRPTGLAILIARTGLVGVVIYALFFLSLWRMSAGSMPVWCFLTYIASDFIFYSDTLFVCHGVVFLLCLMILRDQKFGVSHV